MNQPLPGTVCIQFAVCDIAGLLRSEVHRRGAVRVCDGRRCRVALAPCSRESLRRLQHGAGPRLGVADVSACRGIDVTIKQLAQKDDKIPSVQIADESRNALNLAVLRHRHTTTGATSPLSYFISLSSNDP